MFHGGSSIGGDRAFGINLCSDFSSGPRCNQLFRGGGAKASQDFGNEVLGRSALVFLGRGDLSQTISAWAH